MYCFLYKAGIIVASSTVPGRTPTGSTRAVSNFQALRLEASFPCLLGSLFLKGRHRHTVCASTTPTHKHCSSRGCELRSQDLEMDQTHFTRLS